MFRLGRIGDLRYGLPVDRAGDMLIKAHLEVQIGEISRTRKERWTAQAEENRRLWEAFRTHSHTSFADPGRDNVLIPKDRD